MLFLSCPLQAWFAGEKIGDGTGRTRRDAQCQAAEGSLKNLASKITSSIFCQLLSYLLLRSCSFACTCLLYL